MLAEIGSMLGLGAGQVGSGLFSAASGLLGNMFAAERQSNAQDFSAAQYASRYQTTVKDLEAAGLNPMMAYGQMGGGFPSGSPVGASMPDIGQAITQSKIANAQEANLAASARKLNAEASITEDVGLDKAKAELNQVLTQTGLTAAQIANVNSQTQNNIATLSNIQKEGDRLVRATELLYQQANETFQRTLTETQRFEMVKAQAKLYIAQTGLANLDIEAANALFNSGRIGKELKPFFDVFRLLLRK